MTNKRESFLWHAINAAKVAAVGYGYAKIINISIVVVDKLMHGSLLQMDI